jgi:uncharacterized membrane protein YdjX (TVP38/TMEM64 family)
MKHWSTILVAIAALIIVSALLVEQVFNDPSGGAAERLLAEPGVTAAVAVVVILGIDVFVPIPSSLVMILSGAVFGVGAGATLSLVGSLSGNVLGYELARRYGAGLAARLVGEQQLNRMATVFERYGAVAIILSRPVPVLMETLSLVAGMAGMRRGAFLVTSLLGTVPACLIYAYAGAFSKDAGNLIPAFAVALLVPAFGWVVWQLRTRSQSS